VKAVKPQQPKKMKREYEEVIVKSMDLGVDNVCHFFWGGKLQYHNIAFSKN